jgi:hypothetical protein
MNVIRDPQAFDRLIADASKIVRLPLSIPDRVFADGTWQSVFCSFDMCFGPDILRSCAGLCEAVGDDGYSFIMLEPDPVAYYYKEFRRFGAFTMQASENIDTSWRSFEEDPNASPADTLMYIVRKFVVTSPSLRWAIWGSRDEGVIICGADNIEVLRAFSQQRCKACDLQGALCSFFRVDDRLARNMRENYVVGSRE